MSEPLQPGQAASFIGKVLLDAGRDSKAQEAFAAALADALQGHSNAVSLSVLTFSVAHLLLSVPVTQASVRDELADEIAKVIKRGLSSGDAGSTLAVIN